jgi:cysteinyl-tRNA synthetase
LIQSLIRRGHAYEANGEVLFDTASMPDYGRLSKRVLEEQQAGARVEVAPYKRDPMDFVLWKPSKEGEPGWPSPCGIKTPGRPGWHIECSAMSMAKLLEPFGGGLTCDDPEKNVFDIHAGGIDLVFPHHENELAQSRCAFHSKVMANVWMHNGFLQVEGEKMSKSLGNFITIRQLLDGGWQGEVLRFNMLRTHYRQPLDWTGKQLAESRQTLRSLTDFPGYESVGAEMIAPSVLEALSDDLNMPQAIAELHALHKAKKFDELALTLRALGLKRPADQIKVDEGAVGKLIDARLAARKAKDFKESDRIRDELTKMGVVLKDNKDGTTTWEVAR